MLSLVGIVAGISAVLAIIVTAGIIGMCLLLSWITNAIRGDKERPVRGVPSGSGRDAMRPPGGGRQAPGGGRIPRGQAPGGQAPGGQAPSGGRAPMPPAAGGRRRSNSGSYAGSRRSDR